jgi:DNA mismatch endonuclease, patch repair protein
MQGNKKRDTRPELALRKAMHALGLRYRVCTRPSPELKRTCDVVFPGVRLAVELRGCFWHGCPTHYKPPTTNATYWAGKVDRNMRRDIEAAEELAATGWHLEIVWEHDDPGEAAKRIADLVALRRAMK